MTGTRVARSRQLAVTALTAVFLAGACADGGGGTDTGGVAEPQPEPTECIDAETAEAAMDRVVEDNTRSVEALDRLEPAEAALAMRSAVRNLEIAARASEADPAVANKLTDAAAKMELAAEAMQLAAETLSVSAVEESTEHVVRAGEYIRESTAALQATSLPRC